MNVAPIVLFAFNRPECLARTVASLQRNTLAALSGLFVFVDGPRNSEEARKVCQVQELVAGITGFASLQYEFQKVNRGLAKSVISGISRIIDEYGRVIVVEDDLILSTNFLDYMNQSLSLYEKIPEIFSVSGFGPAIRRPPENENCNYFFPRAHSWGWGSWRDRWTQVDWQLKDASSFLARSNNRRRFNHLGSDMSGMLRNCLEGKINSWYIRFAFSQFLADGLTAYPYESKVINAGFMPGATHCNCYNRYHVNFDSSGQKEMNLCYDLQILPGNAAQFRSFYSLSARAAGKCWDFLLRYRLIKQY